MQTCFLAMLLVLPACADTTGTDAAVGDLAGADLDPVLLWCTTPVCASAPCTPGCRFLPSTSGCPGAMASAALSPPTACPGYCANASDAIIPGYCWYYDTTCGAKSCAWNTACEVHTDDIPGVQAIICPTGYQCFNGTGPSDLGVSCTDMATTD